MGPRPKLTRQRRQQILDAAVDVIAERGLSETRIADVARRAGASPALVLYYFTSKDRLLTEALSHAEDRFYLQSFHELTRLGRATDRLIGLIDLSFPSAERDIDSDWMLWMELWSRALRDPEVSQKREALDRRWRTTIADIVREGQRAGEFSDVVDVEEFALRLAALIDGLAVQVVLRDPEARPERVRRACLEFAAGELGFELERHAAVPTERR
jgi:AcrR family transcriptional regulator